MTMQFFLPLATYPDASSGIIISNAVAFAAKCNAALNVCAIRVVIPPIPGAWSSLLLDAPKMIEEAEALSSGRAQTLIAAAEKMAANESIQITAHDFETGLATLNEVAAAEARFYDLALLECVAEVPASRTIAEAVIFGSGRPVVLFPNQTFAGSVDHLVIAWDGSRAAARAVGDAGLLLRRAKKVSVLSMFGEKSLQDQSGARLAAVLRSSGLNAETIVAEVAGSRIGTAIQRKALALGADILVMGGYGHSRLREFVLGGATSDVLSELLLPILISH